MECDRCTGLMVPEVFEDLGDGAGGLCFEGWRCVTCGEILDPTIVTNRAGHPAPIVDRARRRNFTIPT